jgi:uncharacterized membrane protein
MSDSGSGVTRRVSQALRMAPAWMPGALRDNGHFLLMLDFRIDVAINAPPHCVWAVMRDIERWPEWTPTVRKVRRLDRGPLAVGSRALIWQPKLPPARWKVTELDDARRSFTWETWSPGMRLQARHSVEDTGNTSRATLSVEFSGLLGPLFARVTRSLNNRYLSLEARGLKERSEQFADNHKSGLISTP